MERKTKGVAWYDAPGSGWLRDIWVLSHFPYTCWHLSYAVIGAALAPVMNWPILGWTVLAFFLGMGLGGHALDELNGRPLKTTLPLWFLNLLVTIGVGGALGIGFMFGVRETPWVFLAMAIGAFIVFAYNMEWPTEKMKATPVFLITHTPLSHLPKGFFHRDIWFGLAWGSFPAITAYVAQTHTLSWAAILMAVFALLSSMAQRVMSTQARYFRRKVGVIEGQYFLQGEQPTTPGVPGLGNPYPITRETIIGPADLALKYMTWTVVSVAVALLIMRMM